MSSELQQWYSAQLQQTEPSDSFDMFLQAVLAPEVVTDTANSGDNPTAPGTEEGNFSALSPDASGLDTTLATGSASRQSLDSLKQLKLLTHKGQVRKNQNYRQRQKVQQRFLYGPAATTNKSNVSMQQLNKPDHVS